MEGSDALVPIAMAILATLFVGAFVVLLLICRRQRNDGDYLSKHETDPRGDAELLAGGAADAAERAELELGEVCAHPDIERLLAEDAAWRAGDASGLVAHGLAVLKACRGATQRLATVAMGPHCSRRAGLDMMEAARRMGARVDDVVRALHPPVDARLLEARAQALVLALAHLAALLPRHAHDPHTAFALRDMDRHLLVLREAALAQEASCCIQNVIATGTSI